MAKLLREPNQRYFTWDNACCCITFAEEAQMEIEERNFSISEARDAERL